MKIKQEQIERVCRLVLEHLKEKKMVIFKAPEPQVYQKLVNTFVKNIQQEDAIDEEAKRILEETLANASDDSLDRQKMFLMIKRKIAKERGFIL